MIVLGITGGIGSGKSYISNLLAQRGIPVFDCDSQAKSLTVNDPIIREGLVKLLGPEVYQNEAINKPLLAAYLFASQSNAASVNAIIHPRVKEAFREWAALQAKKKCEVVAIESAILFESGFQSLVDMVLMVYAPLEIRCQRVILRDQTTMDQVKRRIASQMPDEEKCRLSDFIIENDGVKSLEEQLDKLFSHLNNIKGDK